MSSLEHTPTPWSPCYHLRSPDHDKSCGCGYRGSIWSADGETVVLEMGASPDRDPDGKIMGQMMPQADRPTQLADAAFILRAVNSHDALVEALESARYYVFDAVEDDGGIDNCDIGDRFALEKIDAALSLAKSETR